MDFNPIDYRYITYERMIADDDPINYRYITYERIVIPLTIDTPPVIGC